MIALLLGLAFADSWVQLATGEDFTCGRRTNGSVACWGNNEDKQLGVLTDKSASTTPVETGIGNAVDISASGMQACATLSTGQVKCWGQTRLASWGTGELPRSMGMNNAAATSVSTARGCARRRGAYVDCWEQEGLPRLELSRVSNVIQVGVGADFACALTSGGTVWCWGDGRKGQRGNEGPTWPDAAAQVPGVIDAVDLGVGESNVCVVRRTGGVQCWGPNSDGQLGAGDTKPKSGAQAVQGSTRSRK